MTPDERNRALSRLHALMAHTVANGCTEDEEISAARMAGRLADEIVPIDSIDRMPQPARPSERLRAERESADYQAALRNSTAEGLLKAAIQELAMAHINTVAPPGRRSDGRDVQWLDVRHMLNGHLGMALGAASTRMSRQVLADTIEELVQDGMLPDRLPVPVER